MGWASLLQRLLTAPANKMAWARYCRQVLGGRRRGIITQRVCLYLPVPVWGATNLLQAFREVWLGDRSVEDAPTQQTPRATQQ